ncbi:hypothetical protein UFOVP1361_66 [uncultured Caudovirales phage]|uniref:Uncharacterized protein n=1 Tax=uncultured Caudovirales phage TaxID=2100421 RepID=A0A6J5S4R7_9CAUD|nr:hypothetical protein UFOVP1361_66 [uncultured Caudovirales phage]
MGYILAPNGRWTANDKVGNAAIGAFLFTYRNQTRDFKTTYADAGGIVANPNPLQLDSSGSATIFWNDDEYYTIELYSVDPDNPLLPYELIYSEDNYPAVNGGASGDIIINQAFPNIVRNAQFTRWGNNNYLSPDVSNDTYLRLGTGGYNTTRNVICDDWTVCLDSTSSTLTVGRKQFPLGQSEVPANPVNYINYNCSGIGAGTETFKCLQQIYYGVQTLSNTEVSGGFWARSSTSSNARMVLRQGFGTGGPASASTFTTLINVSLTPAWTQYSGQAILPSVAGKTVGTDYNDALTLELQLPLNQVADIDFCNVQLHGAAELPAFPYLTINDQIKRNDATVTNATLPTGSLQSGIFLVAPFGWVLCNDGTIGSAFSGASYGFNATINLFILLWNNIPNIYAPILTSAGVATTRGASAIADFNANKRLTIIRTLGRVIGDTGSGSGLTTRAAGQFLGAESVALTEDNNGPHTHDYPTSGGSSNFLGATQQNFLTRVNQTASSGLGTPHQNMQPTTFATHMIKL